MKTGQNLKDKFDLEKTNFFIIGLSSNKGRNIVRILVSGYIWEFYYPHRQTSSRYGNWQSGPKEHLIFQVVISDSPHQKGNKSRTKKGDNQDSGFSESQLKKIPPLLEDTLIRAILTNRQYPIQMYTSIMKRVKIPRIDDEKSLSRPDYVQAGFIKAYLLE